MFTVTHRLPMGVVLFTAAELASANSFQSLEHENVFGLRPLFWILFAILLTIAVGLWRSTQVHRPFYEERPPTDSTVGWAFVGILAVGFVLGVIFQLFIGVHIVSLSRRWLDVDGQMLAVVFGCLISVGVGTAIMYLPQGLRSLLNLIKVWREARAWPQTVVSGETT